MEVLYSFVLPSNLAALWNRDVALDTSVIQTRFASRVQRPDRQYFPNCDLENQPRKMIPRVSSFCSDRTALLFIMG